MSTQSQHNIEQPQVEEQTVADYLLKHPDFFVTHSHLLTQLKLPHASGNAVSLIERQVELLREHNQQLKQQFQELVHTARSNESLSQRMHTMTLALLDCDTPAALFNTLHRQLSTDFAADFVAVCLTTRLAGVDIGEIRHDGLTAKYTSAPELQHFDMILHTNNPVCGRLTDQQREYLFGEHAGDIASVALFPLELIDTQTHQDSTFTGIMAIGSHDEERFQTGMGTVFLNQLSNIICAKLRPFFEFG